MWLFWKMIVLKWKISRQNEEAWRQTQLKVPTVSIPQWKRSHQFERLHCVINDVMSLHVCLEHVKAPQLLWAKQELGQWGLKKGSKSHWTSERGCYYVTQILRQMLKLIVKSCNCMKDRHLKWALFKVGPEWGLMLTFMKTRADGCYTWTYIFLFVRLMADGLFVLLAVSVIRENRENNPTVHWCGNLQ